MTTDALQLLKHRFNIFPEMLEEDFQRLKKDIHENGYDVKYPIWLYEDQILDGWNRQRACNELKVQPIYKHFEGTEIEAIEFVMRTNKRRNLNSTQWACVAVEAEELIAALKEAAKERQGTRTDLTSDKKLSEVKNEHENKTAHKLAEAFNTNRTYINEAAKLKEQAPEKFEQLKKGEKTISEIKKEQKREVVTKRVEEYKKEIATVSDFAIDIFNTDKKFNIIYADPPWQYWEGGEKNQSLHYKTMDIAEIAALPVKEIADENCILFMWVTFPILHESFRLMEAWGFRYSTAGFVWVKKNPKSDSYFFGNGSWTRANAELCLIGVRGSIQRLDASVSQVLDDVVGEHSQKPNRVRQLITRLVGELPRIELFSRNTDKDGWFNWGNGV